MSKGADERIDVIFGANISDLTNGLRHASEATKETVEGMKETLEKLKGFAEGLAVVFAVIRGGEMFEAVIEQTAKVASSLEVLSQRTGVAVDDLSRLRYAADLSHIGADALDGGMKKLAKTMQDAAKDGTTPGAEAMRVMGLAVKDADGKMRPMNDVLLDIAEKFSTYSDGAAKSALAMNLFGRSGSDMVPLLNKGREGIAALGAESDSLANTMTEFQVQTAVEYENAMKRMSAGVTGVKQTIAVALMPTLTSLATAFTHTAGGSDLLDGALEVVAGTFRFLGTVIVAVRYLVEGAYETIRFVFEEIGTLLGGLASAWADFTNRDFAGAAASIKGTWAGLGDNVTETNERMAASAKEAADALTGLYTTKPQADTDPKEKDRKKDAPDLAKTTDKGAWLAAAREEWTQRKESSKLIADDLLKDEIAFWTEKLALVKAGTKDYRAVEATLAAARIKLAGDERRAATVAAQGEREAALESIDVQRQEIEEKRGLREIDAKEAATSLRALAAEKLRITLDALVAERALADGDLVRQATIDKQIAAAKRAGAKEISTINKQTTLEIAKDWDSALSHITDVMKTSFDGVIRGTQTLGDALRNLNRNMVLDFVQSKATELKEHIATSLAKRGVTTGEAIHWVATHTAAAITVAAATIASVVTQVAAFAIAAAAASWAAIAAIPFVGPFLAPAAAVAAIVGVTALAGGLHSASGGFDIPAGLNPVTQLHASEMVLPAKYADVIRGMAAGGSSGGAGGLTVNVHALDGASVRRVLMNEGSALSDAIHAAAKAGQLSPKKMGLA